MATIRQSVQTKANILNPQAPKGFRDFYGPDARLRRQVVDIFQSVFESYGYEPLETPAMEYAETILGKYGDEADKLVYQIEDFGGRKMALMYEMTASACRFVAENRNKLTFPFKRYQIQKAWRAEKPQKGRFREFLQCDADIWGTKTVTIDAEFIEMATLIMQRLGFKDFVTRINNRKIINAVAAYAGASPSQFYDVTVSVDKLGKIGIDGVRKELDKRKINKTISEKVLEIVALRGENNKLLAKIKSTLADFPEGINGIEELETIFNILRESNFDNKFFRFDPSIVRGLAYYTGPVWEIEVIDGRVGSVAGCGRYDTLTKMISGVDIPASGGSFGIERICEVLKDKQMVNIPESVIRVLVTVFSPELASKSRDFGRFIRNQGINSEVYIDPSVRLDKQLKYADKKGITWVVILGPDEAKNKTVTVKNMQTGKQKTVKETNLIKYLV
ncbi:histidine--tRNA ligase [Candidatus Gottesmanbacteria bacterium]|nr:histidine--tRNA ligase [Candidatus Gottesmanbacteria bacterium]